MHPIGILILVVLFYFVWFGTPRHAVLAMVAGVLYLTQGQSLDVGGVNFFAMRILGVVLFTRVMVRHEFSFSKLGGIDRSFLVLYTFTAVVYFVRSKGSDLSPIAGAFDAAFCYFGFRGLIKTQEDLKGLLRGVGFLLIPYAGLVALERATGLSPLAFMGGPSGGWARDGVPRCMGSFRYPVSLGTFAATFLALYFGLWHWKAYRRQAIMGILLCIWLVWVSNSGGSFSAAIAAILGWGFWYIHRNMRLIRWSILGLLIVLAFVMKAPVWYVITHGPFSGDSWHRAYVIDVSLRNIDEWWLFGMSVLDTATWFPYTVETGGADITNQYLVFGITAGIGAIALFLVLISRTFGQIGRTVKLFDRQSRRPGPDVFLVWGLGVMMFVHVVSWFGVSYFDQIYVIWFLQLAAAVSITERILQLPKASSFRHQSIESHPKQVAVLVSR